MRRQTKVRIHAALILLAALALPAAAQDAETAQQAEAAQEGVTLDCSRWSFKELRLGMKVAAVKERYPTASVVANDGSLDMGGVAYRWQHKEETRLTDFRIIADGDTPEASVILINARIRGRGVSPSEVQAALLEKWGGIAEIEPDPGRPGRSKISGRSVDAACDVRVEFEGAGDGGATDVEITLFSMQTRQDWQMQQQEGADNKARDLLE